jgi:hypothetical protein
MASKGETVRMSRDDLVKALYACGRTRGCAGRVCPLFTSSSCSYCGNDLRLLAAYMLQHDLAGLTMEQIREVLVNGNT